MLSARVSEPIEEAYRRFWDVTSTVHSRPEGTWRPMLESVAAEPLLTELLNGYATERRRGVVELGTVVPHPTVLHLRDDRASVVDCQDASGTAQVELASGEVKLAGAGRTSVGAVLRLQVGRGWRVAQVRYLQASC